MASQLFQKITIRNVAVAFVGAILLTQVMSIFISSIFPSINLVKAGPAILMMLLSIAIITLVIVGLKVDALSKKENLIFIVIVFALVGLGYYFIPRYFPQIFSISPEVSNTIRNTVGSIMGVGK